MVRFALLHRHALTVTAAFALAVVATGCSRPAETAKDSTPTTTPAASAPVAEPQYQPAYPADVSTEALSEKDTQQQEAPHSHGDGKEHTHAESAKDGGDHGHSH